MTTIRRYPAVAAAVLTLVLTAVLLAAGQPSTARWLASIFALAVAAYKSAGMVRDIARGRWGVDLLAVIAIVSTAAVGSFLPR